ncbi:MAG: FAD binding domain-containing protein, partial [SAR324 cluster bacterium]|nr:FAD binding domain-containing protein [SAR324 cluster bacterium]
MIPESFDYQRAGSVSEAISLLQKGGEDAKILAGGHSLIPTMKLRLATPETLIDIGGIAELKYINDKG